MNPLTDISGVPFGVVDFASLISFAWLTFLALIALPASVLWLLELRPRKPDQHDSETPYRRAA